MLRVVDNATLVKQEREMIEKELAARQNDSVILGLAAHLRSCWDAARQAKKPIENIMLRALRQRNGEYEADKLRQIHEQGGSDIYMMITEVKCRAAESWLRDILLDTGTPPWDIHPPADSFLVMRANPSHYFVNHLENPNLCLELIPYQHLALQQFHYSRSAPRDSSIDQNH